MKTAKEAVMDKPVHFVAKPVHFVIHVNLETDPDGDQYTVPRNIPKTMHPGDTVSYESPDGQVTVEFVANNGHTSPYVGATGDLQTVEGGVVLNVVNTGTYFGKCSITHFVPTDTPGKFKSIKTGWQEDSSKQVSSKQVSSKQGSSKQGSSKSGGNHVVKNPPSGP
jgi:hypothetical protein